MPLNVPILLVCCVSLALSAPALAQDLDAGAPLPRYTLLKPGATPPPRRYEFKVTGSAPIAGPTGQRDCWIVKTRYDHHVMFWIGKDNQLVVRQETELPNGNVLVMELIE